MTARFMRGRSVQAFVVALVFVMTPGAFEIVENVAHAATHGDSAHVDNDGHSKRSPSDEHGCSGATHACSCCHSFQFIPAACAAPAPVTDVENVQVTAHTAAVADVPAGRVFRPPRS